MTNNQSGNCCCGLGVLSLALAMGVVWGLGTLFLGWMASTHQWGVPMVHVIGSVYRGFEPTMTGAWWGGLWGFVDGFVGGVVLALVYNAVQRCCKKCCKKKGD
jgi:hypothetical protein